MYCYMCTSVVFPLSDPHKVSIASPTYQLNIYSIKAQNYTRAYREEVPSRGCELGCEIAPPFLE